MPRQSSTNKTNQFLWQYATLSTPCHDLIYDYSHILRQQLERYRDTIDSDSLKPYFEKYRNADKYSTSELFHHLRLYIVTCIDKSVLVLYDIQESIFFNIMHTIRLYDYEEDPEQLPDHIFTVYMFEDDNLIFESDIPPLEVCELLHSFHDQNRLSRIPCNSK